MQGINTWKLKQVGFEKLVTESDDKFRMAVGLLLKRTRYRGNC
ncbi:hypothetical protein QG37_02846 [Candidozyma auris]|uniref:Uncharacterized protein n=1 Tax=Candidozyma auris TaxID=498019 RepID=A0A0L0P2N3_CANAR|nr:hypothetical protein QG37_02846 [[Candida] auris]